MKNWVRKALTRVEYHQAGTSKKMKRVEFPPSERLIYGLYFAFLALTLLTILEALYVVFLRSWNSEVFAAITGIIGTICGVFLTAK